MQAKVNSIVPVPAFRVRTNVQIWLRLVKALLTGKNPPASNIRAKFPFTVQNSVISAFRTRKRKLYIAKNVCNCRHFARPDYS